MFKDKDFVAHNPAAQVEAQDWTHPGYQVVCYSTVRLGDCGTYFYVKDSIAGTMTDGSKAVWLLIEGTLPKESPESETVNRAGFQSPGYKYACYSNVRLGDCGTYFTVKDSVDGTMTDGKKALWLLVE